MQDDDAVTGGGCIRKEGTDNDNDNNKKRVYEYRMKYTSHITILQANANTRSELGGNHNLHSFPFVR